MINPLSLLKHVGLGAGLMYLFDPQMGRRRRALLADRVRGTLYDLADTVDAGVRDLRHRASGTVAEVRSRLTSDEADDRVIVARVRSAMGRWVSHPRAVEVTSRDGVVTLRGPILHAEADRLLGVVAGVRGVREVVDRLEVHDRAGDHPALQGGRPRPGVQPELWQEDWSPATQVLLGTVGVVAGAALVRRAGLTIPMLALAGAAWVLNRTTGDPLAQLPEIGRLWGSERGADVSAAPTVRQGDMI